MGTAHPHLGPIITWDVAVGYGPYAYINANYYDDDGIVSGPVIGGSSVFPQPRPGWPQALGWAHEFADEYGLGKSLLNTDSSWLQFTSPQGGSGMRGIVESTEI